MEAIEAYLPHRVKTEDRHLFVSAWRGRLIAGRVVNAMLKSVIRKAGLEGQGIAPHKLRHTLGRSPHGRAFGLHPWAWTDRGKI